MKMNSKILLEAINKGIKLALDDFENSDVQDQGSILSKKKILNYDPKKDMWLFENFVDLGLPSGTLWCKFNLGANLPEELGFTYLWGDIKPNRKASSKKYFAHNKVLKYCCDPEEGNADYLMELELEDDAAYNYNNTEYKKLMKIPTCLQFEELLKYTNISYQTLSYKGIYFISKINGNKLFLPLDEKNNSARYWSSTIAYKLNSDYWQQPYDANDLFIYLNGKLCFISQNKRNSLSYIRPVLNKLNKI